MNESINGAFMRLVKRAEAIDKAILLRTFVDVGPLFTILSTIDHQIVYGRRGTGKTHALVFLAERKRNEGDVAIYLDLRTIGSSGGLYADYSLPIAERATRLLADTLAAFHEGLLSEAIDRSEELNLSVLGPLLDRFADEITEVRVQGPIEYELVSRNESSQNSACRQGIGLSTSGISADIGESSTRGIMQRAQSRIAGSGDMTHRVHFGALGRVLHEIGSAVGQKRLWFILDEWSAIPSELQPYLADLLRRSVLPAPQLSLKIAAIEQRSCFQVAGNSGDYIGLEVGADVSANVNLDDFMVFDNDAAQAMAFFEKLLFQHAQAVLADARCERAFAGPRAFREAAFTRRDAFEEFVRATEGVPRDAINIVGIAAQTAFRHAISMDCIRTAAKTWYQRDKQAAVASNADAQQLLHKIIDEVIGHRRARAFLLRSDIRHRLIDDLFDKRVLHLLKKNISAHDQPGVRYDVYKIDFGCYVDLLTTGKAPQGLLPGMDEDEQAQFVDVPPDDYRAIRRAILDVEQLRSAEK